MPLQNRVDPFGTIFRSPARGTFMGNRGGAIHNHRREIVRAFKSQRWITCLLEFKGRRRSVMSPGLYTELFFLDEAVSLAAGHRPCAECRRERFHAFRNALRAGSAPGIDAELHRARISGRAEKVTYQAEPRSLPNGSFIAIEQSAYLIWNNALMLWTPERYTTRRPVPEGLVTVLTPEPIVRCLREGYKPEVHESAR
jgi:hypothetical protein